MRNALSVEVLQSLEKLVHDISCFVFAEELIINDILEKLSTFAVLEDEEANLIPLPNLEKLDNVWMVQFLQNSNFVNESLKIFNTFLLNSFDRIFLICFSLLCQVYNTKTARRQLVEEVVLLFDLSFVGVLEQLADIHTRVLTIKRITVCNCGVHFVIVQCRCGL